MRYLLADRPFLILLRVAVAERQNPEWRIAWWLRRWEEAEESERLTGLEGRGGPLSLSLSLLLLLQALASLQPCQPGALEQSTGAEHWLMHWCIRSIKSGCVSTERARERERARDGQ